MGYYWLKFWAGLLVFSFLLERKTDRRLWFSWSGFSTFSWKWSQWACYFKESNKQYLLSGIKIWAFWGKLEFWKTAIHHMSLTASQYLKTFLLKLIQYYRMWFFLMLHDERVDIWKSYVTHWSNIFWITRAWGYKVMLG